MNQAFPCRSWSLEVGRCKFAQQQTFDSAAARHTMPEESGGKDASIVEHEDIPRHQITAELAERCVVDAVVTMEHEQSRAATHFRRMLRDEGFRQVEVEIRNVHSWRLACTSAGTCSTSSLSGAVLPA